MKESPIPESVPGGVSHPRPSLLECSPEALRCAILEQLYCHLGKFPEVATRNDYYLAVSLAVRDRLLHRWIDTARTYYENASRTVVYLSAEYLLGPQLGGNLVNLGIWEAARKALESMGQSLEDLLEQEEEPGLGNGGLGRLAACYMDSMAALQIPSIGYGVRYEFGSFDQQIRDGWQVESADKWLRLGYPWEIAHPEIAYRVNLGGYTESYSDAQGRFRVRWVPDTVLRGTAHDTPVLGYAVNTANLLRLWKAEACESFDFQAFNAGDYYRAVEQKMVSENITKVLYPNDISIAGKQLRLEQQYFFVSCSLQDMIRIYRQRDPDMANFHAKFAVQLNDTHPAIAVAELMRLLVDEYAVEWDKAWEITTRTFAYTNHTLMPEALEKWSVALLAKVLPRHLEIIYEINWRFLNAVRLQYPGDEQRVNRLSLIEEGETRFVRMAHLACLGSHFVNGVSGIHSELLRKTVLRDFCGIYPDRFLNVTNGVTPRRFMVLANPGLTGLICEAIGDAWIRDLERLNDLEPFAADAGFQEKWRRVKLDNKRRLAAWAREAWGLALLPDTLFDVQTKRIHEYKRQHLNALHIITLYNRIKRGQSIGQPRTFLFGGKAAPGYYMARLIIKLINSVAETIRNDPDARDLLTVAFLPDFNVKNGQRIYPAAEITEQISTASTEASGTGNMKFAMNGALTVGTLDGANVEIREAVGAENFFLFGLTAEEVMRRKAEGYHPRLCYEIDAELRLAIDLLNSGFFSHEDPGLFKPLVQNLLSKDDFLVLADFRSYVDCQERAGAAYADAAGWTRMSILNVARMGRFSSDRAIREYCEKIWKVDPVPVELEGLPCERILRG